MKKIILLLAMLFFVGFSGYGQANPCPPGHVPCGTDHECLPRGSCSNPNPPPPGLVLPIDDHIYILLAAGIGLGVYFFVSGGKRSATAD